MADEPETPPLTEEPSPSAASYDASPAGLTPVQLAEAKQYGRLGLMGTLADLALDLAYFTLAATLLARPLDAWLGQQPLGQYWTVRLALLYVVLFAIHVAVSLPLTLYRGYVLEHRFDLSTLTLRGWVWRYAKELALAGPFGLAMVVGLYWIIWTTGAYWWLPAALAAFLVSVVLTRILPVVILPLFFPCERLDAPEIAARIGRLAAEAGLAIEGVYRLKLSAETKKLNAMLAGLGRTRRVLLGDTLLDSFTPDEVEVIFAHEIGHHVFRHIRKMLIAGIFLSAAGFWVCDRLLAAWLGTTGTPLDYTVLPVWTLPAVQLILTVFGLLLGPLMAAVSRRHERQCDRYALDRTRRPDAFVSGFRKLARLNKDDPCPHWLEVLLFHDHPPIGERLAMAETWRGS